MSVPDFNGNNGIDLTTDVTKLTVAERISLNNFMSKFSSVAADVPYIKNEQFMLKWLKARKFDMEKSEAFLRNHLRYRKALRMDDPSFRSFEPPFVYRKYYTQGHFGYDKSGRPVVYYPFGNVDPKGLLSCIKVSDAMRSTQFSQESRRWQCEEISAKLGKEVHQIVYVLDLKGVCTRHLWLPGMEVFQQIAQSVEQHTPELVHTIFVINAPVVFYAIYKLVKPILAENTQQKIKVFGESDWKEALLEAISRDELPVYYGGDAVGPDGDEKCSHKICWGGTVPGDLFYKSEDETPLPEGVKITTTTVSRGSELLLPITVSHAGSTLSWYFKSQGSSDIGFGIYGVETGSETRNTEEMEMVVPYYRLLTHLVPESGKLKIEQPRTYIVQFDNRYSWVTSKTLDYYVVVIPPLHSSGTKQ